MRFEYIGSDISSTELKIIAETTAEVMRVFRHFGLDKNEAGVLALGAAIQAGSYTHSAMAKEKRPWFDCDVYLDRALAPYRALLQRITGYDGPLPDMDLTSFHSRRLSATHITESCGIVDGMYHAHVYIQAEEWNGQAAEVRAQKNADDYCQEDIGKRKFEREFIGNNNGQYSLNPNYTKRHAAEPGLGAPWLWSRIFAWWRENHATVAQRAVLDAVDKLREGSSLEADYEIRMGGGDEASLVGYTLYALDPTGNLNYDGNGKMARTYKWEEFRTLGR